MVRQVFGNGVVRFHLAALDHVGQEQRSKDFGDGADFKERVAVRFLSAGGSSSGGVDMDAGLIDGAGDDADGLAGRNAIIQQRLQIVDRLGGNKRRTH